MTVSDDVMDDLLTLYLAGEASAGTRALIDERARHDAAFAGRLAAGRSVTLTDILPAAPPRDMELQALKRTRHVIFLRTLFFATGLFFTLLPFAVRLDEHGVEFVFLGRQAGLLWASGSVAAASWTAWYVIHRQLGRTGL